jgi:hypothetical protein
LYSAWQVVLLGGQEIDETWMKTSEGRFRITNSSLSNTVIADATVRRQVEEGLQPQLLNKPKVLLHRITSEHALALSLVSPSATTSTTSSLMGNGATANEPVSVRLTGRLRELSVAAGYSRESLDDIVARIGLDSGLMEQVRQGSHTVLTFTYGRDVR